MLWQEVEAGKIKPIKMLIIIQMAAIVVGSLILNFYWFYLMCKMIIRVLSRLICPKRDKHDESIELVSADQLKEAGEAANVGSSDEHGYASTNKNRSDKIKELGGLEV